MFLLDISDTDTSVHPEVSVWRPSLLLACLWGLLFGELLMPSLLSLLPVKCFRASPWLYVCT